MGDPQVTPAPCRHMFTMTLRNGDRECRRCGTIKHLKPVGEKK